MAEGVQEAGQGAAWKILAQHQPQAGRALRHGGGPNGDGEQSGRLQPGLQGQGRPGVAHQQGKDGPLSRRPGPAGGLQPIAPAASGGAKAVV